MNIIDPHHHLWDPQLNDHPWLRCEPMIPFRYGDYSALRQPFLLPDYDRVSSAWNVVASVTMEGEWNPEDPAGEVAWMAQLREQSGRPAAHVAQAWLDRDDLPMLLEQFAELAFIRSVRHKPQSVDRPAGHAAVGGMSTTAFQQGYARLAGAGLHFDLQTPWWHLHEVEQLVRKSPQTLVIINHTGLPADRSAAGIAAWLAAMQQLAQLPQIRVKISGLGVADSAWNIDDNREIILRTIDVFGTDRCMFASNFPVDGLCGSFDTLYSGYQDAVSGFSVTDTHALFYQTAYDTYLQGLTL